MWSDGTFTQEDSPANIQVRFYGPNHPEVVGVFYHPTDVGAFGGNRIIDFGISRYGLQPD